MVYVKMLFIVLLIILKFTKLLALGKHIIPEMKRCTELKYKSVGAYIGTMVCDACTGNIR